MCPECLATEALVVADATSAGGLTALVVKTLRAKTGARSTDLTTRTRALDTPEDGHAA